MPSETFGDYDGFTHRVSMSQIRNARLFTRRVSMSQIRSAHLDCWLLEACGGCLVAVPRHC